jgi:hypothetical protein
MRCQCVTSHTKWVETTHPTIHLQQPRKTIKLWDRGQDLIRGLSNTTHAESDYNYSKTRRVWA